MSVPDWLSKGWNHIWLPYTQMQTAPMPLPVACTAGSRIILADGQELIDGVASWWTACHGYNHPHITAAVAAQLREMPHVMFGGLAHAPAYRLAARLANLTPEGLDRVFFTDSGSVAVEVAMKIAIQAWLNRGERRSKFMAFRDGYHGDTMATMAVCDPEEGMHALFSGVLMEHVIAPLPRNAETRSEFERLMDANASDLAGIIVEPLVQGAGGMVFHDPEVLRLLRSYADHYGLTLIFDEIFTGFGRTAAMFAHQLAGVRPDILTLSKALTGGTSPLAATIVSNEIFKLFLSEDSSKAFMHGPTFMANPLGCAAANASLDLFESEDRLGQANKIGAQMKSELGVCRKISDVVDVRVMGAIGVVQLKRIDDVGALQKEFIRRGVWVRPLRNVIYLTPALTIQSDELSELTHAIGDVLSGS